MRRLSFLIIVAFLFNLISCNRVQKRTPIDKNGLKEIEVSALVERTDTNGLIILVPSYSSIVLRCRNMPKTSEKDIILFAEAAYTGAPLDKNFNHFKIAGDHVSNGIRYRGYKCNRNTGAFVYYNNHWKFCFKDYSTELDSAAKYNGAAFAQEMMIHKGEIKKTIRPDGNVNTFRALCEFDGKLCIIESLNDIQFGNFKCKLKKQGVSEAIYLDMGTGWNYAWYRIDDKTIVRLHPKVHEYCTNWITFLK